jgi:hypothetical protein
VTVLSRWAVQPYVGRGSVRALRITADGHYKHWGAAVPRHIAGEPYIAEFLKLVVAHAPTSMGCGVIPFKTRAAGRRVPATSARAR